MVPGSTEIKAVIFSKEIQTPGKAEQQKECSEGKV